MESIDKKINKFQRFFFNFRSLGVLAILIILVVLLTILSPKHNFIRLQNINHLLLYGSEFAVIVLGVGVLMIAGEFDLSIGSVLAFCSFILVWLVEIGINPFIASLITLICGVLTGFINGLVTVKSNVLSFITTLGTMMLWRGTTLMISEGIMRPLDVTDSKILTSITTGELFNFLPMQALWFVLFTIILGLLLHNHRFGNWIYATGDNKKAARAMYINTDMVKIVCFVVVGLLCAFTAIIQTVRLSAFSSRVGTGWELKAIAAAVVGGTSLRGGRGNMAGIFLGALIIVVIENALTVMRLPYEWTYVAFGLIIMLSSLLDLIIERRAQKEVYV